MKTTSRKTSVFGPSVIDPIKEENDKVVVIHEREREREKRHIWICCKFTVSKLYTGLFFIITKLLKHGIPVIGMNNFFTFRAYKVSYNLSGWTKAALLSPSV